VNIDKKAIPELSLKKNPLGKWAGIFIKRFRITLLIIIALVIWGTGNYMSLQREAQPKVTIPFAYVQTMYIGASPEEVETLVTEPIEKRLDEIEGVKTITSSSGIGNSIVFLEFETGEDVDEKVREAKEKLSGISAQLPSDANTPEVYDMKTGQSPVLIYALTTNEDILTLQEKAKKLQKEMELSYGVKEVVISGDIDREIQITIDPQKLTIYNISIDDIHNALAASNVSFPAGKVELNGKEYSLRTSGKFETIEDIENVIIRSNPGSNIILKNVASIEDTYEDRKVFIHEYNGKATTIDELTNKNTVVLAVLRKDNSDEVRIKEDIEKVLDEKESELVPKGFELSLIADKADYVDKQLGSVTNNAISGLFLVVIVLFLFIGLREALIVSFVIPMSLLASFGFLKLTGNTLNEITMFSLVLAVGMLVDNAIVVMENIDRLRKKGLRADIASLVATNQIAPAILASTLTTVAAFLPMLFTSGIIGDFIKSIPMTIIITLSCSFFMAITITPSICAILLKGGQKEKSQRSEFITKVLSVAIIILLSLFAFADFDQPLFRSFTVLSYIGAFLFGGGMAIKQFAPKVSHTDHIVIKIYSRVLSHIIAKTHRKLILIGSVGLIFVLCVSMPFTGILSVEMFGGEDMPEFSISIKTPSGSSIHQTKAITKQVEEIILDIPEIDTFVSYVGTGGLSIFSDLDTTAGDNPIQSSIEINLKDLKERERTSSQIVGSIRQAVRLIPGADIEIRELESGPPSGSPVYVKLKGDNLEDLETTATDIKNILASMEGIRDPRTSFGEDFPELEVKVDSVKAATLGLDERSIAASLRSSINGIVATTYRDNQDDIDIVIRTTRQKLETIYDLEKLTFYNRSGVAIPFSQVAEIIETKSVQSISHEDGKRIVHVAANIDEDKWTAAEATAAFQEATIDYPFIEGVSMSFGGEMEAMGDSFGEMMLNMVMAALFVYIILAVQFNSLSQPFIILFTVPLSIIGVMLGLLITGNNFGFVAFIGVVALVGIAVNDAIVFLDYINYLRGEGYEMNEAITETGVTRFIPVMATTITTAGGILPITLSDPFFAPMGVALISGLSMATILTLGVIPAMYSLFEGKKIKVKEKLAEKQANNPVEDYLEVEYEM
jgi:HAE1 family hydrophobic/amphiphilic exporter-1